VHAVALRNRHRMCKLLPQKSIRDQRPGNLLLLAKSRLVGKRVLLQTTSVRKPSISGRAIEVGIGVTKRNQ
jgi:hypothetical protein